MASTLTSTKSVPSSSVSMLLKADEAARSRMEAAEALLGVSPNTTATSIPIARPAAIPFTSGWEIALEAPVAPGHFKFHLPFPAPSNAKGKNSTSISDRPASGLEALAMLASSVEEMDTDTHEQESPASSADDASSSSFATEQQPHRQRPRSVSNPEGMEKWDSLRHAASTLDAMNSPSGSTKSASPGGLGSSSSLMRYTSRKAQHFMQPTIFENSVLDHTTTTDKELRSRTPSPSSLRSRVRTKQQGPLKKRTTKVSFASTNENTEHVVPRYIKDMEIETKQGMVSNDKSNQSQSKMTAGVKPTAEQVTIGASKLEFASKTVEVDVKTVKSMAENELKDLLADARSKLMDDVVTSAEARTRSDSVESDGSITMSSMILPHDLTKYRDVYNKNGRIGVYTPSERAAIIARFQAKRSRRVWNKKIRYSCRKDLADKRLRVKGRFVKRVSISKDSASSHQVDPACTGLANQALKVAPAALCSRSPSPPEVMKHDFETMPDVDDHLNDEDAQFCPTDDLPYRRTRRHTIT